MPYRYLMRKNKHSKMAYEEYLYDINEPHDKGLHSSCLELEDELVEDSLSMKLQFREDALRLRSYL